MVMEHKHGPIWMQNFVAGNVAPNAVLLRIKNGTDNTWYISQLRIVQSVSNNAVQSGWRVEVLQENTDVQNPAVGQDFNFPANTRVFTIVFATPLVVRPRQIINVRAGTTVTNPAPANTITSVLLT